MDQYLEKLKNKQNLSFDESKSAFEILMTGEASEDQIYDFLTLLSAKGETTINLVIKNKTKKAYYRLQMNRKFDLNQLKALKAKNYVEKITV